MTFSAIIARYGDDAVLRSGTGETAAKCFIEPALTARSAGSIQTELGARDAGRYYGFFPAGTAVDGYSWVVCRGTAYDIVRAELYGGGGTASHWEAALRRREEASDG